MAYGVCAYPRLKRKDFKLIQDYRKENDKLYYSIVQPHFSFVFPVTRIKSKQFVSEILNKSKGFKYIDFEIRCAVINKDAFIDYYHLFLIPDKGYSDIVKLHDKLYSGILFNELRLDIDFIPHIGIANSKDKYKVKKWFDNWNKIDLSIKGTIDKLTVVDYTNSILTNMNEIKLV